MLSLHRLPSIEVFVELRVGEFTVAGFDFGLALEHDRFGPCDLLLQAGLRLNQLTTLRSFSFGEV